MNTFQKLSRVAAVFVGTLLLAVTILYAFRLRSHWNAESAAHYLDRRERYWSTWPAASRDHGTFCVSCHTTMPYVFARPALRAVLGQPAPTQEERALLENVSKRVRIWNETEPYYTSMPERSRGTEAVLNALILAGHDSQSGKLSPETRAAFDILWHEQQSTGELHGAWNWILFDNEPWEAADSPYYGACLAAVAAGIAPENYSAGAAIQPQLDALRDYLQREASAQMPINRVNLLWASTQLPGLLTRAQQQAIVNEILPKQHADGGWSLADFTGAWQREDGTPQITKSDGYATGFFVFVLQQWGMARDDRPVANGLSWLTRNQGRWEGQWYGYSLNKRRHNPFSTVARFMDDAATAWAVLALTDRGNPLRGAPASPDRTDHADQSALRPQPANLPR